MMLNPVHFVPVVGTPLEMRSVLRRYDQGELEFDEAALRFAGIGLVSGLHLIAGLHFAHGALGVRHVKKVQRAAAVLANPMTSMAGATIIAAVAHHEAKKKLQNQPGYSANKMQYTTPFSAGFGTVV